MINNTVKDLDECINNTDKLLSDEEKKDQNIILEILENKKIFSDPNAPLKVICLIIVK